MEVEAVEVEVEVAEVEAVEVEVEVAEVEVAEVAEVAEVEVVVEAEVEVEEVVVGCHHKARNYTNLSVRYTPPAPQRNDPTHLLCPWTHANASLFYCLE